MDPGELDAVFRERPGAAPVPGLHGRPRSRRCARRSPATSTTMPPDVWREAPDGRSLESRLLSLPGIGEMKAKSLIAVLGKRFDVRPPGYEAVAPTWPTLGDVDSAEALATYQAGKRAHKAAMREAAGG